jgi:quercetin dioxygenase-like cupin family protein
MTRPHHAPRRPSRRSLFHNGLAAVATLAFPGVAAAGDDGFVQQLGKVEPENYPWGWIRRLLHGEIDPNVEITLGLVQMEPNQVNTLHVHPNSAEVLHVISGSLEHLVGQRWVTLKAGDTLRIPKGVRHQGRTSAVYSRLADGDNSDRGTAWKRSGNGTGGGCHETLLDGPP